MVSCSNCNRRGERINRSAQKLCSKLRAGELRMTMDTVTRRDGFILARALKRRPFRVRRSGSQVTECSLITSWTCYHLRVRLWKIRVDVIYEHPWKTTRSCGTAVLCDTTHHLNSLNLQLQKKQKLRLLIMMSDVAAEPVWGRKCPRLCDLTMGLISTRLDCAHLLEFWEGFSSQLADIKPLKSSRHSPRTHLLVMNGPLQSVSPV